VGVFKQVKEMANVQDDAPARVEQAEQMAANAQALSAAGRAHRRALAAVEAAPATASSPDFEPIAAVSLELYAQISKSLATIHYDLTRTLRLAGDKGVCEETWAMAVEGWNARMAANPSVSTQFSALYAAS
jgi:hypothetical protein